MNTHRNNNDYMQLAIDQAQIALQVGDFPFGSVVVDRGKVVGSGGCRNNTTGDVTDHAEMIAIREACRTLKTNDLSTCSIYTTNEPCLMCASAIFQAKIRRVIIGVLRTDLPQLLRQRRIRIFDLAKDAGYQISIETGVLRDKILQLFQKKNNHERH